MEPTKPPLTTDTPDLTTVVMDVLGDLAFMVSDDGRNELPAGTIWMQGEIGYKGSAQGTLRCWCTRAFAAQLAANLLGIEPNAAEAQIGAEDAVKEFMNVLCGQLVTLWHGTADVYTLSIPTVCECTEAPADLDPESPTAGQLCIDGEPLLFTWCRES